MRPTGLGSGIDKDRPDYGVYSGEWEIVEQSHPHGQHQTGVSEAGGSAGEDPTAGIVAAVNANEK